jgi:hypothetical protein
MRDLSSHKHITFLFDGNMVHFPEVANLPRVFRYTEHNEDNEWSQRTL